MFRILIAAAFLIGLRFPAVAAGAPPLCEKTIAPPENIVTTADTLTPVNLKTSPLKATVAGKLEVLCWIIDPQDGRIMSRDGKALTQGQLQWFLSDYDLKASPLSDEQLARFYGNSCRFKDGRRIICSDQKGLHTMSNLDVAIYNRWRSLYQSKSLANGISNYLSSRPNPAAPLTARDIAKIKGISYNETGNLNLPSSLAYGLKIGLSPAELQGHLNAISRRLNAYFDASQSAASFSALNKFPSIHTGEYSAKTSASFFDGSESRLSARIQRQVASVLSKNPVGRELLKRFGKAGRPKLPGFLVGNGGSFGYAYSLVGDNVVLFNAEYIIDDPMFSSLSQKEKKALLADNGKLTHWLLDHPQATRAFIRANDFTIAHELTHEALDREIPLGPYVPWNILDNEHEAFTLEMRYAQAQIEAHPEVLDNPLYQDEIQQMTSMIDNYGRFLRKIDESYSVDALTIPQARQIVKGEYEEYGQSLRMRIQALKDRTWSLAKKEGLKMSGLLETQSALALFGNDYDKRTARFRKKILPGLREQARRTFPYLARQALERAQKSGHEQERYDLSEDALYLSKTAGALGGDASAVSLAKQVAASFARDDLKAAAIEKDTGKRYDRISWADRYAQLSGDPASKLEAEKAARDYIAERFRAAAKEDDRHAHYDLRLADDMAQDTGDAKSAKRAEKALAALGKTKLNG